MTNKSKLIHPQSKSTEIDTFSEVLGSSKARKNSSSVIAGMNKELAIIASVFFQGTLKTSREYLQTKMLQTLKLLKPQIPSIPYSNYQDQQESDRDTPHTALAYS